jgi:hypothetical protein
MFRALGAQPSPEYEVKNHRGRNFSIRRFAMHEVLERMVANTKNERKWQVRWLKDLSIVEEERLYSLAGFPSLWAYVTKALHYSEGSVGKRIQVARTAREFPRIYSMMEDMKMSMSVVSRLAPHLTPENSDELLAKASGLSARDAEILVASLAPKPDVQESVRKVAGTTSQDTFDAAPSYSKPKPKEKSAPLSAQRFHVNFTVDKDANEKQRRLAELTRNHANPVTMEEIFRAGLDALLKKHDPAVVPAKPRAAKPTLHTRYISREIKRIVYRRDGGRCTYVSPDGRRCCATTNLHYDHIRPWALGGSSRDPANIRLLCASHNLWAAVRTFGEKVPNQSARRHATLHV